MNVTVTPAAEAFMRRLIRMSGAVAGAGFRLVVTPGGCAGMVSQFSVDDAPQDGDTIVDVHGVRMFLPQASCTLLDGAAVDFADGATASGLRIVNPNLGDCGCGSTTPGHGGRHAAVSVDAIRRMR